MPSICLPGAARAVRSIWRCPVLLFERHSLLACVVGPLSLGNGVCRGNGSGNRTSDGSQPASTSPLRLSQGFECEPACRAERRLSYRMGLQATGNPIGNLSAIRQLATGPRLGRNQRMDLWSAFVRTQDRHGCSVEREQHPFARQAGDRQRHHRMGRTSRSGQGDAVRWAMVCGRTRRKIRLHQANRTVGRISG